MTENDRLCRAITRALTSQRCLLLEGIDDTEVENVRLCKTVLQRWVREEVDSVAIDASHRIPPSVLESAAELGLFGLTIPEEYGGAGFSLRAATHLITEVARRDRAVGVAVGLHCGMGTRPLVWYGSDELKERYLPALASGEKIASFSATEVGAGSDIAAVKTVGTWDAAKGISLTGSKIFVTNAGFASVYTIFARTPGLGGVAAGHSLLFLDRDTPGFTVGPDERKLGLCGSSTAPLYFDDVLVPTSRILGSPGNGHAHLHQVLAWGRTLMAAGLVGAAETAYRMATDHARTRHQFGRPIGSFDQVREKLTRMRVLIYSMQSAIWQACETTNSTPDDLAWEGNVVKVFNTEGAWSVVDEALQIFGGSGYIEQTGIAQIFRDCRIGRIFEGANEILRVNLASSLLMQGFARERLPKLAEHLDARLEELARRFDELHRLFRQGCARARHSQGLRIANNQFALRGIADGASNLYVLLAVLRRTNEELRQQGDKALPLVDLACFAIRDLGRAIESNLTAMCRDDEHDLIRKISSHELDTVYAD